MVKERAGGKVNTLRDLPHFQLKIVEPNCKVPNNALAAKTAARVATGVAMPLVP